MIDWTLSVTRLLQFASILMLFGSAVFCLYGRELEAIGVPGQHWAWPRSVLLVAPAVGIVATFGWLMAEAESLTGTWTSWGAVLMSRRFGAIAALRAGLAGVIARYRPDLASREGPMDDCSCLWRCGRRKLCVDRPWVDRHRFGGSAASWR